MPPLNMYTASAHEARNTELLEKCLADPTLSPATKLLIKGIIEICLPTLEFQPFAPEDLQGSYQKWNRHMTTSPLGRHLDHYFSLLPESSEDGTKDKFWEILSNILNFAVKSGTILQRWKQVLTLMILKEPNNFNINCL